MSSLCTFQWNSSQLFFTNSSEIINFSRRVSLQSKLYHSISGGQLHLSTALIFHSYRYRYFINMTIYNVLSNKFFFFFYLIGLQNFSICSMMWWNYHLYDDDIFCFTMYVFYVRILSLCTHAAINSFYRVTTIPARNENRAAMLKEFKSLDMTWDHRDKGNIYPYLERNYLTYSATSSLTAVLPWSRCVEKLPRFIEYYSGASW